MRSRWLGFFLTCSLFASLTLASAAGAVGFTLRIWENSVYQGAIDAAGLGCGSGTSTTCSGAAASLGDLSLDSWSLNVDSDPVLTGTTAVTNNGATTQRFTLIFTLALAVPVAPASLIGGSIQGGATDNTGDGVVLSTVAGSSFYTARIDGVAVQKLYPHTTVVSTNAAFDSANLTKLSFGAPIPSQLGPAANNNIAIRLDFTLTPGDSASFTSNFVVQSVPEPATMGMLAPLALGALAIARRWRR
jgi:hypothetical protein